MVFRFCGAALAVAILAAPAAEAGEVIVGAIHPITGPAAFYGAAMDKGAVLGAETVNAGGGFEVAGEKTTFRLLSEDTQASPVVGVAALRKVMAEGARYVIGPLASGLAPALTPIIENDPGLTQIIDGATAEGIVNGRNIFRPQAVISGFNAPTVALIRDKGWKRVALITDRFMTAFMTSQEGVVAEIRGNGAEVVREEHFQLKDTDFSAQVANIVAADPDAALVRGYTNESALITRTLKDFGYQGAIIWQAISPPAVVTKNISDAEMAGVFNAYPPTAEDYVALGAPAAVAMDKAYRARFGEAPGELAALSYDSVMILRAAMRKAGATDNAAVNAALAALRVDEVEGLVNDFTPWPDGRLFDDGGQANFLGYVHVWEGGRWSPLAAAKAN